MLSCVRQMDFFSRHALIQDKAENTERCAGGGALLYTGLLTRSVEKTEQRNEDTTVSNA